MKLAYKCIVCGETGKKSEIIKQAESGDELVRSFSGSNLILISYKPADARRGGHVKTRVSAETVMTFTENMAALLRSGLSVRDALSVCAEITAKTPTEKLCIELERLIIDGEAFCSALSLFSPSFSPLYVSLVRLGESIGSVEKVFERLASYLRTRRDMKRKIVQALLYPVTVCVTALAVCVFIAVYVFPRIQDIFAVFTAGSAASAADVPNFYETFGAGFALLGSIGGCIAAALLSYRFSPSFAGFADKSLLRIPFIGNVSKAFNTNDFAFAMELLCASGVPIVRALEESLDVVRNRAFRDGLKGIIEKVSHGEPLSRSFNSAGIFPAYVTNWLGIGERTGQVEQVFGQIHHYFEKENSHLLGSVLTAAEPAFILVTGVLLLVLVGRFVLPVFSLLAGM